MLSFVRSSSAIFFIFNVTDSIVWALLSRRGGGCELKSKHATRGLSHIGGQPHNLLALNPLKEDVADREVMTNEDKTVLSMDEHANRYLNDLWGFERFVCENFSHR